MGTTRDTPLSLLLFSCLLFPCSSYSAPLERRIGFVASTNGGSESFQPLADLLTSHADSWSVAHAYCSSPGEVTNDTVLPNPPFCWRNWTVPIMQRAPHVSHVPIQDLSTLSIHLFLLQNILNGQSLGGLLGIY